MFEWGPWKFFFRSFTKTKLYEYVLATENVLTKKLFITNKNKNKKVMFGERIQPRNKEKNILKLTH